MTTITDIAKACGTSKATVSKIMNGNDLKISAGTRKRVMEAVRRLDYQPSAMARGLSMKRANTIGIVTPNVWHILSLTYYATLIGAILDEARNNEQTVSVFNSKVWAKDAPDHLVFADGRCDGLVLVGVWDERLMPALQKARIPFVLLNGGAGPEGAYSIDIDNFDTAAEITRYLIAQGHKRIAYFDCGEARDFAHRRFAGYRSALAEAGIRYEPMLVFDGPPLYESAYDRGRQVASRTGLGITALFCASDLIALAAMRGLQDSGLRVPDDVSVVGINGIIDGDRSSPRLTTVTQSLDTLGAEAVRLLLDVIEGRDAAPRHVVWPTMLIERDSVAAPAGASIELACK
ncbi:MAG: LacI family DNA-binding transcriptional regulator [Capsulimonadaceae bacterium]|nr:LacI family DNA-binding transcriptional regulator [Capsulimonadaceae bacterium]